VASIAANIAQFFYSVMKTHQKNSKIFSSHGHLRIVAAHWASPIDSFEQHR
jgi:hypothetical protein